MKENGVSVLQNSIPVIAGCVCNVLDARRVSMQDSSHTVAAYDRGAVIDRLCESDDRNGAAICQLRCADVPAPRTILNLPSSLVPFSVVNFPFLANGATTSPTPILFIISWFGERQSTGCTAIIGQHSI